MAKIQASMVPERRELSVDPSGETFVVVKPPSWVEERQRAEMLKERTDYFDERGMPKTDINVNTRELTELEIWLTYVETNLEVEFKDKDGKVEKVITFEPKEDIEPREFFRKLAELPGSIVYSWREAVVDVVPDWRYPF